MRSRPPGGEQNRDREELAFLLPFFGTLLVLPPLVNLFVGRQLLVLGVPLDTLYLFSVWLALVIGAMLLSRRALFRDHFSDADALAGDEPDRVTGEGPDKPTAAGLERPVRTD
jgi:hypothetical protein